MLIGGVVLPLAAGLLIGQVFGLEWHHALFLGAVLTATSVSISAQTLRELGRLRSREGSTILGAAIIDDVLGVLVDRAALYGLLSRLRDLGATLLAVERLADEGPRSQAYSAIVTGARGP